MEKFQEISVAALERRLNRKLIRDGLVLKKCRYDSDRFSDNGRYYLIELRRNSIVYTHVDILIWSRSYGVLADNEFVVIGHRHIY